METRTVYRYGYLIYLRCAAEKFKEFEQREPTESLKLLALTFANSTLCCITKI